VSETKSRTAANSANDGNTVSSGSVVRTDALESSAKYVRSVSLELRFKELPGKIKSLVLFLDILNTRNFLLDRAISRRARSSGFASRSRTAAWRTSRSIRVLRWTKIKGGSFHRSTSKFSVSPEWSWRASRHVLTGSLSSTGRGKTWMNAMRSRSDE